MSYGLSVVSGPASEPVTVSEVKSHARINTSDDDTLISTYISAARILFERWTSRSVVATTWKMTLDSWVSPLILPRGPVTSVTKIEYYDTAEALQTWSSTNYTVDLSKEPAVINFHNGPLLNVPTISWYTKPAILVTFVAGWASTPALVKQAILLQVAEWYANRTAGAASPGFETVCSMYQLGVYGDLGVR